MRLHMHKLGDQWVEVRFTIPTSQADAITHGSESYGQACKKMREKLQQWMINDPTTRGYIVGRIP